jgi:hypothetical protein
MPVLLDINNREFQQQWFSLEKMERLAVLQTCAKFASLEWDEIYRDKGLKWEVIKSRPAPDGSRLYSIRVTRKFRAAVWRRGPALSILSLHPDHDSIYH